MAISIQHAPVFFRIVEITYFVEEQVWCNIDHLLRLVLLVQSAKQVVLSTVWIRECNLVEAIFFGAASLIAEFYDLPLSSVNCRDYLFSHDRCL